MSRQPTPMSRQLAKLQWIPGIIRHWLMNYILRRQVPFIHTAGARFDKVTQQEVIVHIPNKHKAQNHIHGIHACATALICETASGFVTMMNCPKDKLLLLKALNIKYIKVSTGEQSAIAHFSDEMAATIAREEKGSFVVPVTVHDEKGNEPVIAELIWAWVPKKSVSALKA